MVKAESAWGDVKGNLRLLEALAGEIEGKGVDVLITPECFLDGYMVRKVKRCTVRKLSACSVTGPRSPTIKRVMRLAKRLGCNVVCGASQRDRHGAIRNVAYLIDREGGHLGTYIKVMPNKFYAPGPDLPVFETDFARVGCVICADRRWPENIRCLRLRGAEIILNPTWGRWGDQNTIVMRTRAYENGIPICFTHPKQALICLADGSVGAVLESNVPAVLVHEIDLADNVKPLVNDNKASSHPVQNRRPELYGAIAE